jgi:hypothetical protein
MAAIEQFLHGHTADVPGSPCDEYFHAAGSVTG